jgi:hypothetical protein
LRAGAVRRQERRLYTQSLRELSESFEDDVKPLVVEIQGTQHRLTGTADAQYEEWQGLLRDLFISETGFTPDDIEVFPEPAAESPAAAEPAGPEVQAAPSADAPANSDSASNPDSETESQEAARDGSGGAPTDA